MSQKSSLPQVIQFVSEALMPDKLRHRSPKKEGDKPCLDLSLSRNP
jgi:hypothetical protein